jgi:hypothetical protein
VQAAPPETPERRGPSRATVAIGAASFGAVIGFFLGAWVGVAFLGMALIDSNAWLPIACSTGAGIGWLLGALVGTSVGAGAPRCTPLGRLTLFTAASTVIIAMVVLVRLEGDLADGGSEFLSNGRLGWYRVMTVVCAVLAAATFVGIAGDSERAEERPPGRGMYFLAAIGISILGLLLLGVWMQVRYELASQRDAKLARPVQRTVRSLVDVAAEYEDVHGVFPRHAGALLSSGGRVHPEAVLVHAARYRKGFCVIVGRKAPNGTAVEPFFAGVARRHSLTFGGNTCRG